MNIEIAKLLDSNFLTYLLEGQNIDITNEELVAKLKALTALINDEDIELVITPLLRYEFLRKFDWQDEIEDLELFKTAVDEFTWLDITKEVTDLATDLYRLDKYESNNNNVDKNLEKRKFDVFHFATAKVYGIELLSNDTGMPKLEALYQRYLEVSKA